MLVGLLMFTLMHMLPGDPAMIMLGDKASDASIAQLRHELALDRGLFV